MERAEFATGSVNVRGSSAIHRILSFLGAVLFGIGPAARAKESDKWWEREDYDSPHDTGIQMTLGQQAELFDIAGQAVFKPLETPPPPVSAPVPPVAAPAAPRTIVSVQSKSRTTARDLATLSRRVISEFPEYYAWYSTPEFTFNGIRQYNRNALLRRDESVDGIKTGHTESAGFCLASSAKRGEMRLISVVMGSKTEETRAQESQSLLNYGFRFFETHKLYTAGQVLARDCPLGWTL